MTEFKDDPDVQVAIEAFPSDSDDLTVKTLIFGAGTTQKLLVELQPTEEGDVVLAISLDGVAEDDILNSLEEFGEILLGIAKSENGSAALAEVLEKKDDVG